MRTALTMLELLADTPCLFTRCSYRSPLKHGCDGVDNERFAHTKTNEAKPPPCCDDLAVVSNTKLQRGE
jgi:hypothetical protein